MRRAVQLVEAEWSFEDDPILSTISVDLSSMLDIEGALDSQQIHEKVGKFLEPFEWTPYFPKHGVIIYDFYKYAAFFREAERKGQQVYELAAFDQRQSTHRLVKLTKQEHEELLRRKVAMTLGEARTVVDAVWAG